MSQIPKLLTHTKGFFYVRVTGPDGKRHDRNFGRDRVKAEFQYNQFVAELCQSRNNPQPTSAAVSLSIAELVGQYLESIRDRYVTSMSRHGFLPIIVVSFRFSSKYFSPDRLRSKPGGR